MEKKQFSLAGRKFWLIGGIVVILYGVLTLITGLINFTAVEKVGYTKVNALVEKKNYEYVINFKFNGQMKNVTFYSEDFKNKEGKTVTLFVRQYGSDKFEILEDDHTLQCVVGALLIGLGIFEIIMWVVLKNRYSKSNESCKLSEVVNRANTSVL